MLSQQRVVDLFIKLISSACKKNAEALSAATEDFENNKTSVAPFSYSSDRPRS